MSAEKETRVVIIEDERSHAEIIRQHIDKVLKNNEELGEVKILPANKPSYYKMEEFIESPDGKDSKMRAFLIVDLFLAKTRENPSIVFHQLMYNLFKSPTDPSLVCGRLGVLSKLRSYYTNAYVELFSYFPLYFVTQNEPVYDDGFIYSDIESKEIKHLVKENHKEISALLNKENLLNKDEAQVWDLYTATQTIQTIAMREALYERIKGIFNCTNVFDHMTENTTPPNHANIFIGTPKTTKLHKDAESLATKLLTVITRSQGQEGLS
jgi:hypothetical protein